ncbi:MAG: ATP cone domain-containing protein [Patescibacteria group bacterium]
MNHIVKRAGHSEKYDQRKLYASLYYACISVRETEATAEMIADAVCKEVGHWLSHKHEVTANDIRKQAAKHMHDYHPEAAYMYLHHRVIH